MGYVFVSKIITIFATNISSISIIEKKSKIINKPEITLNSFNIG